MKALLLFPILWAFLSGPTAFGGIIRPTFYMRDCEERLHQDWGVRARAASRRWLKRMRTIDLLVRNGKSRKLPEEAYYPAFTLFKSRVPVTYEEAKKIWWESDITRFDLESGFEVPEISPTELLPLEAAALRIPPEQRRSTDDLSVTLETLDPNRLGLVIDSGTHQVSRIVLPLDQMQIALRNTPLWWQFQKWHDGEDLRNRENLINAFMRDNSMVVLFPEGANKRFAFAFQRRYLRHLHKEDQPFHIRVYSVYACDRAFSENDELVIPDASGPGRIKTCLSPTDLRLTTQP